MGMEETEKLAISKRRKKIKRNDDGIVIRQKCLKSNEEEGP